eukprot:11681904-Prorocentrum_lima.AAC.1
MNEPLIEGCQTGGVCMTHDSSIPAQIKWSDSKNCGNCQGADAQSATYAAMYAADVMLSLIHI